MDFSKVFYVLLYKPVNSQDIHHFIITVLKKKYGGGKHLHTHRNLYFILNFQLAKHVHALAEKSSLPPHQQFHAEAHKQTDPGMTEDSAQRHLASHSPHPPSW